MWSILFDRFGIILFIIPLLLNACSPWLQTAVTPPPLSATVTTVPTATAVPPATTEQATSTPTAVPPTPEPPIATSTAVPTIIPSPTATIPADLLVISPENVDQLTQLAQFGNGRIDSITWSPNGKLFAVGNSRGVDFYDAQTLQKTQTIQTGDPSGMGTHDVRFSPSGEFLIITTGGYEVDIVALWDVASGQYLRYLESAAYTNFIADGQLVYFDWVTGQMIWHDPVSGENTRTLELAYQPWAFNLVNETAAELYQDTTIRLYDMASGQLRHTMEVQDNIDVVTFSPQGDLLAIGSRDGIIRLWDVQSGNLLYQLVGHFGWVGRVVFSDDGRFLATVSYDGIVRLWGLPSSSNE